MVLAFLSASIAQTPVPVNPGWTPSAFMGLVGNFIMGGGVIGGLKIFASHLLAMRKIADARAQQVDKRGDDQNAALSSRVTELERAAVERERAVLEDRAKMDQALSDERRECDRQLAEMRGELREMQTKIDGFVRQMIAYQTAEARALPLSSHMTRAVDSLDTIKGSGE